MEIRTTQGACTSGNAGIIENFLLVKAKVLSGDVALTVAIHATNQFAAGYRPFAVAAPAPFLVCASFDGSSSEPP